MNCAKFCEKRRGSSLIPEISVLVNWAFASSLLILFVLLLRRTSLQKKLSHTLCYALWLPVLLRLLLFLRPQETGLPLPMRAADLN